ncbi:hypothetical protein B5E77_09700 [Lachnoclostridium sp. An131]|uniref:ABC transporter substrate-binding protein n=1 Tax=Lachnoclostridium sp. An131 TaxID=1965555 RepID=UPI000B3AC6BB|nr:ABC transporter substrate-binding protein [Lachnoclostridium sp. An131]OUQ26201.1 hypothetical protein B5E77_09700 [Lachnoclostridium sp. An131]
MKKHSRIHRITAWLLLGAVLLTCGCSGGGAAGEPGEGSGSGSGDTIMGRYVEQEAALPEAAASQGEGSTPVMTVMNDGSVGLLDRHSGLYRSQDQGETWEQQEVAQLAELAAGNYISSLALAPDGSIAAAYSPLIDSEEGEALSYQYFYLDADGEEYTVPYDDEEDYLHQLWFGRDSRLYGISLGGRVYELDCAGGTKKQIFEITGVSDYVCFTENYMVILSSQGLGLYDVTNGTQAQTDQVLEEFVTAHYDEGSFSTDTHNMVAASGEGDVLYLALSDGIYRHAIGGSAIEQVADGSLNSLGNPMMMLQGMTVLEDEVFLILYYGAQLMKYVYDPEIAATPEEEIRIYSLYENYTIRQAVSLYQKAHPEVYVNYEVGISGEDGMTEEDAVRNLNTRLASGSGPDLLVLDGLPKSSYEEKGLLADLTELEAGLTGENSLFPNLVDAVRTGDKLYSLPVRFSLPLLVGSSEALKGIMDLASLADTVERIRAEQPSGGILGLLTEEQVLKALMVSSSGSWLTEDRRMDEAALTEFLTQAKRIYEAELAGYTAEELSMLQEMTRQQVASAGTTAGSGELASSAALNIAMGDQLMGTGEVNGIETDFNLLATLADQEETVDYSILPGQMGDSFLPEASVGILESSVENAQVTDFFCYLFGREFQDLDLPDGLPVNQASFAQLQESGSGDENAVSFAVMTEGGGGDLFSVDVYQASAEHFARLQEMAETVSAVGNGESAIEDAVLESGPNALNGSASVEDTVAEIVQKAAIYLAE